MINTSAGQDGKPISTRSRSRFAAAGSPPVEKQASPPVARRGAYDAHRPEPPYSMAVRPSALDQKRNSKPPVQTKTLLPMWVRTRPSGEARLVSRGRVRPDRLGAPTKSDRKVPLVWVPK
jgi:hypothetical protein